MKNKNTPPRLEKVEEENVIELLNKDIMFKVKFYLIVLIAMIIFIALCFLVQHQTYGFINW